MPGQHGYIFGAGTKWRNFNGKDAETVIQVFPEASFPHLDRKVPVGGCDDADIRAASEAFPDTFKLAFLEYPQEFALERRGYLSDFVQEQCSVVSQLETTDAVANRTRKRTFDVTKKLTFEQFVRGSKHN